MSRVNCFYLEVAEVLQVDRKNTSSERPSNLDPPSLTRDKIRRSTRGMGKAFVNSRVMTVLVPETSTSFQEVVSVGSLQIFTWEMVGNHHFHSIKNP